MTTNKKFLILLRRGMGLKTKEGKSPMPDVEKGEWALLMQMAKEQSVQGVFERGVRMMPADQLPPRPLLLRSFMLSEKIAKLNRKTDEACVKLSDMIEQAGLPCCILKGQGNALMYLCMGGGTTETSHRFCTKIAAHYLCVLSPCGVCEM